MMGQTIGNHILAMSAAVIAREIDGPEKAWLWIENTLIGPGLYPDIEEAKALGGAQAWFNVQNDEERKRLKGISEEPDLNDHIKNAILAYLDEEKAAQTAELKATVASICERLGCDNLNGAEPALRSIDELHAQISSLTTNATNTRRALSDAINRLSADLATERQAREALQERADVVDVEFVAPRLNAKGYALKVPKRPLRSFGKEKTAKSAAMAAARASGRGEVFALIPVGVARKGAEWRNA